MKKTLLMLLVGLFALSFCACQSEKEKAISQLEKMIKITNEECPSQVDEVTIWENTSVNNENLIYSYTITEEPGDDFIPVIEEMQSEFKDQLYSTLRRTPEFNEIKSILVKGNLGIVYSYKGSETGKTFDIVFTPEEVEKL